MTDNFWTYVFIVLIGLAGGLVFFGVAALLVFLVERAVFSIRNIARATSKKEGADTAWVATEEHEREVEDEAALEEEAHTHPDIFAKVLPAAAERHSAQQTTVDVNEPQTGTQGVPAAPEPILAPVEPVDTPTVEPELVPAAVEKPTTARLRFPRRTVRPAPAIELHQPEQPAVEPEAVEPEVQPAPVTKRKARAAKPAPMPEPTPIAAPVETPAVAESPDDVAEFPTGPLVDPLAELRARLANRG